jgi:hypothetical protein
MDLVTLVTACALSVEPKLMHALIWHQSGGEPWAVSVRNEPMPRVYSSMQEAISETRAASGANGLVRVGLTGLPLPSSKVNPAMFLPCLNVAIAAQRIAKLVDRCNMHRRKSDFLCGRRLSWLMGTAGRQIRRSGNSIRCERGRSQLRSAEGHQCRIPRHCIRDAAAVERSLSRISFCL